MSCILQYAIHHRPQKEERLHLLSFLRLLQVLFTWRPLRAHFAHHEYPASTLSTILSYVKTSIQPALFSAKEYFQTLHVNPTSTIIHGISKSLSFHSTSSNVFPQAITTPLPTYSLKLTLIPPFPNTGSSNPARNASSSSSHTST